MVRARPVESPRPAFTFSARALIVVAACLLLCAREAAADRIAQGVHELGSSDSSYKIRLAAALGLSKSKDPRAVIAVADALDRDDSPTIRRVSALALRKMVDEDTPDDARSLALGALSRAARKDRDPKVRATASSTLRVLGPLRKHHETRHHGNRPAVFVNIDTTIDQSRRAPRDAPDRVTRAVRHGIEKTGYATNWPGGLPTSAELSSARSRAFIVASSVKKIDISHRGGQTTIACTVTIRIAPWKGRDGGEKWEANQAASASGSAKAMTGSSANEVSGGVRDCLEAVAEDVTSRQVVPFLKRLATQGS